MTAKHDVPLVLLVMTLLTCLSNPCVAIANPPEDKDGDGFDPATISAWKKADAHFWLVQAT